MDALYKLQRKRELPTWRSILYVPANIPRFIAKAASIGADAITVDLEDAVPPQEKQRAREALSATVAQVGSAGADVIVRINRPISLAVRDAEAAVGSGVCALTLPKIDGPSHVRLLDELVTECEDKQGLKLGHTAFLVAIETPEAFECMREIASASPRVVAMMLSSEDLPTECGFEPSEMTLWAPKQQMVFAAAAAGVRPLGFLGTLASFKDPVAFREMIRRSRQFGFTGASCIHPMQVAVLNEEFGASDAEIALAQRIVDEYEAGLKSGRGTFQIDGMMIDIPVVDRARKTLARRLTKR